MSLCIFVPCLSFLKILKPPKLSCRSGSRSVWLIFDVIDRAVLALRYRSDLGVAINDIQAVKYSSSKFQVSTVEVYHCATVRILHTHVSEFHGHRPFGPTLPFRTYRKTQ